MVNKQTSPSCDARTYVTHSGLIAPLARPLLQVSKKVSVSLSSELHRSRLTRRMIDHDAAAREGMGVPRALQIVYYGRSLRQHQDEEQTSLAALILPRAVPTRADEQALLCALSLQHTALPWPLDLTALSSSFQFYALERENVHSRQWLIE